ncbi:hypothetical protein ACIQ4I_13915 [Rummeliibacillus sp. NPDC094406]|uniref:hypothetical protein n=1 Tax=Rummeliibacillus sp. NPDC094406 TaxID=3364511 RepID=UPI00380133AC
MKHFIDTQFDLAILIALEEMGEPISKERIVHKTKSFWQRWKKHSQKQEVTRIRGRLSDLTTKGIILCRKENGREYYYLNRDYKPKDIIGKCMGELFQYVPISFWSDEVLFDYEEVKGNSLIFTLQEIREIVLKYDISEYV